MSSLQLRAAFRSPSSSGSCCSADPCHGRPVPQHPVPLHPTAARRGSEHSLGADSTPHHPLVPLPPFLPMDKFTVGVGPAAFPAGFPGVPAEVLRRKWAATRNPSGSMCTAWCPQLLPLTSGSGRATASWGGSWLIPPGMSPRWDTRRKQERGGEAAACCGHSKGPAWAV